MYKFEVPKQKQVRVIMNTDAKNEADDQFTIVHALLTPKFNIKGIIGAHFGTRRTEKSMEESYKECMKVLDLMDMTGKADVLKGSQKAIVSEKEYEFSSGARRIVEEALVEDDSKLYVVFLGPITDLACAYLHHPEIAGKLTAIWIGGGPYPQGGMEFNLSNDIKAANIIMKSGIELWQVPSNVYSRMLTSLAELQVKVYPYGRIGRYLFEQMVEFNEAAARRNEEWTQGESWCLGDSPVVGLMLDPHGYAWNMREAPLIGEDMKYQFDGNGRNIRVYEDSDSRFILEDMFAKLRLNYGKISFMD